MVEVHVDCRLLLDEYPSVHPSDNRQAGDFALQAGVTDATGAAMRGSSSRQRVRPYSPLARTVLCLGCAFYRSFGTDAAHIRAGEPCSRDDDCGSPGFCLGASVDAACADAPGLTPYKSGLGASLSCQELGAYGFCDDAAHGDGIASLCPVACGVCTPAGVCAPDCYSRQGGRDQCLTTLQPGEPGSCAFCASVGRCQMLWNECPQRPIGCANPWLATGHALGQASDSILESSCCAGSNFEVQALEFHVITLHIYVRVSICACVRVCKYAGTSMWL